MQRRAFLGVVIGALIAKAAPAAPRIEEWNRGSGCPRLDHLLKVGDIITFGNHRERFRVVAVSLSANSAALRFVGMAGAYLPS
jgi:hypothetical protein